MDSVGDLINACNKNKARGRILNLVDKRGGLHNACFVEMEEINI